MNITIRDCKIYHLLFTACHKNIVIKSSIVHGYLTYSKDNVFKNNSLHITRAYDTLRGKQGNILANSMQVIYSLPFCFMVFASVLTLFNNSFFILITSLAAIFLFSLPIIDLQIKEHKTKMLPENIFENNVETNLNVLLQIYADYRL